MKLESRIFKIMSKLDQLRVYLGPVILALGIIVFLTLLSAIVVSPFTDQSVLPAISISAGVLIAIVTFFLDRERNLSKVFLERAVVGFDEVVDLLSDQNNNRTTWIHAARTLLHSLDLGTQIKSPEYKKVFQLQAELTRAKLYEVLSLKDAKTGGKSPLPPQFFFGLRDWQDNISLNELAKKASIKIVGYRPNINVLPPRSYYYPLSDESIVAIYNFMKFPEGYSDPLESVEVWSADWNLTLGIYDQGARQYIAHRKDFRAIDGKLFDRKTNEEVN